MSVGSDTRPDTSKYGLWCSRNYLHKVRFLPHYEEIIGVLVNDLTMTTIIRSKNKSIWFTLMVQLISA